MERPHYHGHRKRLRERFLKSGLAGFAEHEVIELLLTLAIPRSDVKQPAKALLTRFGSLRGVLDASLPELRSVEGIGEVAAVALHVIRESAARYLQEASEGTVVLRDPERLGDFWRMRIGALKHEVFAVAYLDSGYRLLRNGVEALQEGTVDRAAVYPRRVVEAALRRQAAGLVLANNHPNGHVQPSEHDKVLTRAMVLAAETIIALDGRLHTLDEPRIRELFERTFRFLCLSDVRPIGDQVKESAFLQVINYFRQNQDEMHRVIETEVDVSLEKDGYILAGKADLLLGGDGKLELLDFKTSPRPRNSPDLVAAYERQLRTYAHILEHRHRRRVDRLLLYWTSEARKEDALMELPYRPERVDAAGHHFDEAVARIQAAEFAVVTPPEAAICTECDLRTLCYAEGVIRKGAND